MKGKKALSLVLFALFMASAFSFVGPAYAAGVSNTVTASYVGGAPPGLGIIHYTSGGTASTTPADPYPQSVTSDSGSALYAQDAAPGGTSTNQVSSTPLTYGKVLDMPFGGYGSG
ncbi:MAG: hypothetical protein JRN50_02380, partial [Nitrososphaerota archaeon]|nr:hypothetical protein [Nitrososphaerota archaeon]